MQSKLKIRESVSRLKSKIPENIVLTLSGGGHRATLFGLGVLIALVDRGLNKRVKLMSSVSGGSILNAFMAFNCRFSDPHLTAEVFDQIAAKLVKIIVHNGVLTRPIIFFLLCGLLLPPPVFIWLAWKDAISWYLAALLVSAWLCLTLLRGMIIEWLIEFRYFPGRFKFDLFPLKILISRKRFGDISPCCVEHIFCCTDLLEPSPAYFSTQSIGKKFAPGCFFSTVKHKGEEKTIFRCASDIPIATAVRASAGFPGIPPRLIHFKSKLENIRGHKNFAGVSLFDPTPYLNKTMILADGGIWNNLGTQVIRESNWNVLEYQRYHSMALITVDASVALKSQRVFPYCIPIRALFHSLVRISDIIYRNTIEPRVDVMLERKFGRNYRHGSMKQPQLDAVVEILGLTKSQAELFKNLEEFGYLRGNKPWDIPLRLMEDPEYAFNRQDNLMFDRLSDHKYISDYQKVVDRAWYSSQEMFKLTRKRNIDLHNIGTHLDCIHKDDAMALLAHGYLHAFFWTADLKYLEMEEIDRMEKMPQRLCKMMEID